MISYYAERGVTKFYDRGTDHPNAKGDPVRILR